MSKRVMIVDDSKVVHAQMKKMLAGTEFEVACCCQSGESSIEEYGKRKPDIVTMDIIMPGMEGLEAAKKIMEKWPEAKIVMISSLAYDDTIGESEKIGTAGFLFKPIEKEALLSELRKFAE